MNYQFIVDVNKNEYDDFVNHHPLTNLFQESAWANVKKEWKPLFIGVKEDNQLVATALVLIRPLPMRFTLFYIPRGPLLDYTNIDLLHFFFQNLKQIAKQYHAISIKIDPNILLACYPFKDKESFNVPNTHPVIEILKSIGFKHSGFSKDMGITAQPRYQACFYYGDEWEKNIPSKVTKAINKATKKGVEIELIDKDKLPIFARLMACTENRKGVALRSQEYFERLLNAYPNDSFTILTKLNQKKMLEETTKQIQDIEKHIQEKNIVSHTRLAPLQEQIKSLQLEEIRLKENILIDGDIVYLSCLLIVKNIKICEFLYAGLNERYKFYNAPYLAYYKGIEWASEHGCAKSNFGGIPGTFDDGLTEFKGYFNPNIDEYIGEFDLPVNTMIYPIFMHGLPYAKKFMHALKGRKS